MVNPYSPFRQIGPAGLERNLGSRTLLRLGNRVVTGKLEMNEYGEIFLRADRYSRKSPIEHGQVLTITQKRGWMNGLCNYIFIDESD